MSCGTNIAVADEKTVLITRYNRTVRPVKLILASLFLRLRVFAAFAKIGGGILIDLIMAIVVF